jgi:CRP-like cAMP-binding protein
MGKSRNTTSYKNLKKYCYFSSLSDSALKTLSEKMNIIKLPAGTPIIREDTSADAFYLVKKGEVEVLKKTKWGQTAKISVVADGESFGEMALLTCSPRCCSVNAKSDVTLYKLLKTDFEEIVLLEPEKMVAVIDKLEERKFAAGEDIIIQGEKGNEYYIVKSGKVVVSKMDENNEFKEVATFLEGEGFGEEALLSDSFRSATVRSVDETVVFSLSKDNFEEIMKSTFLQETSQEDVLADKSLNTYLDIRTRAEFDESHLPKAVNIPLDELRGRYSELNKSDGYYVYCLVGARSATAAFLLNSQGFNARSIKGGLLNWSGPVDENNDGIHEPFKPT